MKMIGRNLIVLLALAAWCWPTLAADDPTQPVAKAPDQQANPDPRVRFADPPPPLPRAGFDAGQFLVRTGEVIVFTGPTNAVLAQQEGSLEMLLALGAANQKPRFRHMGWEGDTVYDQGRVMNFGNWTDQFAAVGASTIFTWFGQIETLDDEHSDEDFAVAYDRLLAEFEKTTPRLVVVTPPPFEKPVGRWVTDNTPHNERLKRLVEISARVAAQHKAIFVDIFAPLVAEGPGARGLMNDGMHLTPAGQQVAAKLITKVLGKAIDSTDDHEALRHEIVRKNRLWFDCWRTMNWAFPYGDRTSAQFSKPSGNYPSLDKELEKYKSILRAADARIVALALGETPPPPAAIEPLPPEKHHPPDEEQALFKLRDDFEINLWASEADGLVKPMQFCWDERGRLWALCTPSYPQLVPGIAADDYVLVCEDTNGDGRADRFSRFAEGLTMPTGLALGDGGLYVCEATQLIHLADTDGDGKADRRRVVFSGFGTGDSHQLINSLVWGPDGRLWFTQGLHIISTIETPKGIARCSSAGVWRMNPRTLQLESFLGNAGATENAWGVGFDDWGQSFYDPGNQNNAVYLQPALSPVPERYITKNQYQKLGSIAVSKAKGMEIEFISSSHLPDDLQGLMAKSIYMASNVDLHQIIDERSGFRSEPRGELLESTSPMFRPLETRVGPDGAIYLCDWCNPIIGHYQASYRDPERDHTHGRIWRLSAKNRPLVKPPALQTMQPGQLIDQLASPEYWIRQQAKELLYRLPSDAVLAAADSRLGELLSGKPTMNLGTPGAKYLGEAADSRTQTEHFLYELTGVFAAHEAARPALIDRLLASAEPRLRAFGAHMVGLWADQLPDPLAQLRRAADDDFPRVRMEAAVAASYVPAASAVEVATLVLDKPRDPWIDYALTETVLTLKPLWYPAMINGELSFDGRPDHLAFVLAADGSGDVAKLARELSERSALSEAARTRLWVVLAQVGTPNDLAYLLSNAARQPAVLDALAEAAARGRLPAGERDALAETLRPLIASPDQSLEAAAIGLAGAWKLQPLAAEIRRRCDQPSASPLVSVAAIGAIARIDGLAALPLFTRLLTPEHPAVVRAAAIRATGTLDLPLAARVTAEQIGSLDDEVAMTAWLLPIVERQDGAKQLAEALSRVSLGSDTAKLAHRALTAAGQANPALMAVLNKSLGIAPLSAEYSPERVAQLAEVVRSAGNARRGREVFLSKLANCTACHKVAGQGGDIGPDLSAVGAAVPLPLIVESILWPNRQVKEGFVATRIVTSDGQILTGYKLKEDEHEVLLRDSTTRETRRIAREDIEQMVNAGSVMPDGLTAGMTEAELRDLIRYLSELGRPDSGS
jgi:putative heme-binding domain-containing protein